ncbi:hypothetical protein K493DRAFT_311725 [Basidiobolus meristosporus CBS 931.73]|uniref:Uncharacterized protein n=1 Tax=Basidiobolus meristosporus CBS 931.73 TaxID=1314790 RepID=A0A1Y1Z085_9FUNG|nr:hypothetical protein K493DRAFT_311725 [Basidiobolus meristosporus CBS 931.73]|eukprot:ORY03357.1 hypothetical protein K493DRAFT_311725 [Basidiobolus meristosporus CBS 931.73]
MKTDTFGIGSLTDIESRFNGVRIPEVELPDSSSKTIGNAVTELYKLQEDLQIYLQGGPIFVANLEATQKSKAQSLLEQVLEETALYEEFLRNSEDLHLDKILNESDSEEFLGTEALDSISVDSPLDDTQSNGSRPSLLRSGSSKVSDVNLYSTMAHSPSSFETSSISSRNNFSPSSQNTFSPRTFTPTLSQTEYDDFILGVDTLQEAVTTSAFRWTPLMKISSHLYSDSIKHEIGLPSVLAASGYIAVGTSRGFILLYDFYQNFVRTLDPNSLDCGGVSSLAISSDHSAVVCGYERGHIAMWDIQNGSLIRSITPMKRGPSLIRKNGHRYGASIVHVSFVGAGKNKVVSGDDQGMVFIHLISKVMLVKNVETTRLLGKPQEAVEKASPQTTILGLSVLPYGEVQHVTDSHGLMAIITPHKLLIIQTKPSPEIVLKVKREMLDAETIAKNDEHLSGCIAWYPSVKRRVVQEQTTDPLLAFSWNGYLCIINVKNTNSPPAASRKRGPNMQFVKLGEWNNDASIVGLQWLSYQILIVITNDEQVIAFDPRKMQELERCSISTYKLIYRDLFNAPMKEWLSQQSATAHMEMAYYHSVRSHRGKLFALGVDQLYFGVILSWSDRIVSLMDEGDYIRAIRLVTSFLSGDFNLAVTGLPDDEESRIVLIGEKLLELISASLNYAFSTERSLEIADDSELSTLEPHYAILCQSCFDACLSMDAADFLFNTVYEKYIDFGYQAVFISTLEPYILEDKIKDLPPSVMLDFVKHYSSQPATLPQLEQCILHMNPYGIDIDRVLSVSRTEGLYDALIYVWNRGVKDYTSPIVELISAALWPQMDNIFRETLLNRNSIPSPESQDTEIEKAIVSKLFAYIEHILTGRWYPDGSSIPPEDSVEARLSVYQFLFSPGVAEWVEKAGQIAKIAQQTQGNQSKYPYLSLLLSFDVSQLLLVLENGLDDGFFDNTPTEEEDFQHVNHLINRQQIVDALLVIAAPDSTPYTNHIYCFVAQSIFRYKDSVKLSDECLHNILVHLTTNKPANTRLERQKAAQCLLKVYTPHDEGSLTRLYEDAGFYRILENIYKKGRKYGLVITTYLKDEERKQAVFGCVRAFLANRGSRLNEDEQNEVRKALLENIEQLVAISPQETAGMMRLYFRSAHHLVIRQLESKPQTLLIYLRAVLDPKPENETFADAPERIPSEIHELYISMLCTRDPGSVLPYLQRRQGNEYRMEKVLQLCQQHSVLDAVIWIQEITGNVVGALKMVIGIINERVKILIDMIEAKEIDKWSTDEQQVVRNATIKIMGAFKVAIQLCERASQKANLRAANAKLQNPPKSDYFQEADEVETLWFLLLSTCVDASKNITKVTSPLVGEDPTRETPVAAKTIGLSLDPSSLSSSTSPSQLIGHIVSSFKIYLQTILNTLLYTTSPASTLSLPRLLLRLIQSDSIGEDQDSGIQTVAEFRDVFYGILDTYKYEGQLLEMTNKLVDRDLFSGVELATKYRFRGWRLSRGRCELCSNALWSIGLQKRSPKLAEQLDMESEDSASVSATPSSPTSKSLASPNGKAPSTTASSHSPIPLTPTTSEQPIPSNPGSTEIILFRCGHGYHRHCAESLSRIDGGSDCRLCAERKHHNSSRSLGSRLGW